MKLNERMQELAGIPINEATKVNIKAILNSLIGYALDMAEDKDGDPLSDNYTIKDVSKYTLKDIEKRIKGFVKDAGDLIVDADEEQLGYSLFITGWGYSDGWDDKTLIKLTDKHFNRGMMDALAYDYDKKEVF